MHGLTGERWTSLHYKHELGSQQNEAPSAALERVLLSPSCRTSHVQPGVVGWLKEIGERFKSPRTRNLYMGSRVRAWRMVTRARPWPVLGVQLADLPPFFEAPVVVGARRLWC